MNHPKNLESFVTFHSLKNPNSLMNYLLPFPQSWLATFRLCLQLIFRQSIQTEVFFRASQSIRLDNAIWGGKMCIFSSSSASIQAHICKFFEGIWLHFLADYLDSCLKVLIWLITNSLVRISSSDFEFHAKCLVLFLANVTSTNRLNFPNSNHDRWFSVL